MDVRAEPLVSPARPISERVTLARAALAGALAVPGVRGGDAGSAGLHFTATEDRTHLDGVICSATAGGYSVSLQLVCEPVPLVALSARIRDSVLSQVRLAGVLGLLASVDIHFSDLVADRAQ